MIHCPFTFSKDFLFEVAGAFLLIQISYRIFWMRGSKVRKNGHLPRWSPIPYIVKILNSLTTKQKCFGAEFLPGDVRSAKIAKIVPLG